MDPNPKPHPGETTPDDAPTHSMPEQAARRAVATVRPESTRMPVVPLLDWVAFPEMAMPLQASRDASLAAVSAGEAMSDQVVLVAQRRARKRVRAGDLFSVGTVARIIRKLRMPDGSVQVLLEGQHRAQLSDIEETEGYLVADVIPVEISAESTLELEALRRVAIGQVEAVAEETSAFPPDVVAMSRRVTDPSWLCDYICFSSDMSMRERQEVLETFDTVERLRIVVRFLTRQAEILDIKSKIQGEIQDGIEKAQRDFYLREQMKAIQRELGISNPLIDDTAELRERVDRLGLPDEVRAKALREVSRLEGTPPTSPETGVIRGYLDWLLELPWVHETDDNNSLRRARRVLDQDHYGLPRVKERIAEFLAVRSLASAYRTPILCLVGPPGVGKTSLGRSVARALGREFVRISLGGVRDEAEIRGHRRTYVGALPGRILQSMRRAGSRNPVMLLDEIDKIGRDFRGDPSSALLEVLDPEHNHSFSDHYLGVRFDLSRVLFITTANDASAIPPVLRDRMEVIEMTGYTEDEKVAIADGFLLPRQLKQHGLQVSETQFSDRAIREVIRHYTREAGVRNLERALAATCRKIARRVAGGGRPARRVSPKLVRTLLGPPRFRPEDEDRSPLVGVATGLAVTPFGGEVLDVEAAWVSGGGKLRITGQLGDVMTESAEAAFSYVRSRAPDFGVDPAEFERRDLHVHVPAGGVPKDGPSAGITIGTAIISAATGRPVRRSVAMTGEITLRGRVLPIGGLKEKVLAAHRAGLRTVVAPVENRADLGDIPHKVRRQMRFMWVSEMDAVLQIALLANAQGTGRSSARPAALTA